MDLRRGFLIDDGSADVVFVNGVELVFSRLRVTRVGVESLVWQLNVGTTSAIVIVFGVGCCGCGTSTGGGCGGAAPSD